MQKSADFGWTVTESVDSELRLSEIVVVIILSESSESES
jgi:hypothetical protein